MVQEDKELLLRDLCGRLPYCGLICQTNKGKGALISVERSLGDALVYVDFGYPQAEEFDLNEDDDVKPYLRPMSSMTEEEKEEFISFNGTDGCYIKTMDFCHKHHLDNRGLIPMGLALEAPEGMYKKD